MNDASWQVITLGVPSFCTSLFLLVMLLMFYFTVYTLLYLLQVRKTSKMLKWVRQQVALPF